MKSWSFCVRRVDFGNRVDVSPIYIPVLMISHKKRRTEQKNNTINNKFLNAVGDAFGGENNTLGLVKTTLLHPCNNLKQSHVFASNLPNASILKMKFTQINRYMEFYIEALQYGISHFCCNCKIFG